MSNGHSDDGKDPLSIKEIIDVLTKERYELKSIGLEFQKAMRTSFFTFLSILVSIGTLYSGKEIIGNKDVLKYVLVFLSQAEVVLAFFVMTQLTVQTSTSTYARMLEDALNRLNKKPLLYFESVAMRRLVNHWRAAHFWSMLALVILLCLFFALCMIPSWLEYGVIWYKIFVIVEIVGIFACVARWLHELQKGPAILETRLKEYEKELELKPR